MCAGFAWERFLESSSHYNFLYFYHQNRESSLYHHSGQSCDPSPCDDHDKSTFTSFTVTARVSTPTVVLTSLVAETTFTSTANIGTTSTITCITTAATPITTVPTIVGFTPIQSAISGASLSQGLRNENNLPQDNSLDLLLISRGPEPTKIALMDQEDQCIIYANIHKL